MSARCDMEALNFLALNLAVDILNGTKSIDQARMDYGKQAMAFKKGEKQPYTQKLVFNADRSAADPDKPLDSDMKVGTDAAGSK